MNGLAALLALALAQGPETPPAGAAAAEKPAEAPPAAAGSGSGAAPGVAPARAEPPEAPALAEELAVPEPPVEAAPRPEARPRPEAAQPPPPPEKPPATAAPPLRPPAPSAAGHGQPPVPSPPPAPRAAAAPRGRPAPPAASRDEAPERAQVARAAVRFLEALLSRRAADLAALCAPDFSFDGGAARGQEEVRGRWSEAIASHDGVSYLLYDLEVLPAAEAVARFGKPPRRLAGLLRPGSWIALANLSGRPTFVFFARQGAGWVATGLHD